MAAAENPVELQRSSKWRMICCAYKRVLVNVFLVLCSSQSLAGPIVNGSLYTENSGGLYSTNVDYWYFTTTGGYTQIDSLSWETTPLDPSGRSFITASPQDVNGDGEIAFFDSLIHLFKDDGDLSADDLVYTVDDAGIATLDENACGISSLSFQDGSLYHYDACIGLDLSAGNYLVAIGTLFTTVEQAIAGLTQSSQLRSGALTCAGSFFCESFMMNDHGDYQLSFSDNVKIKPNKKIAKVSSPQAFLLFLGMAALLWTRRKISSH